MKKFINGWSVVGAIAGAIGGFLYWDQIGCLTGHCPIQSHWQTMMLWGGTMGYLLADFVQPLFKKYP